jgi:acid stress-induced BolA-like protein IbaG/YrbA
LKEDTLETPKKKAMHILKQLADHASWDEILRKLAEAKEAPGDFFDSEQFMRRVKTLLNDEFPDADALKFELNEDGDKISGYIVSREFTGMEDADRQDRVWDVLEKILSPSEQSRILSVLAYTPEDRPAQ